MGIIVFYGAVHIEQWNTSEEIIANAIAHCEWAWRSATTFRKQQLLFYSVGTIVYVTSVGLELSVIKVYNSYRYMYIKIKPWRNSYVFLINT